MSVNAGSKGLRIQVNNNQKKEKNLSARERNCDLLAEKKNHIKAKHLFMTALNVRSAI